MRRYGPYVVEGELGRGGVGVIYHARHERAQDLVALKVQLKKLSALAKHPTARS
ncbi:MAG: hypothetical protein JKY65_23700 [Planctomycetes bacterium]|nr:hypothetical protein [Planctomycetota bacterium]